MNTYIIEAIDKEIASLQEAKRLLSGTPAALPLKRRGRPAGVKNKTVPVAPVETPRGGMSAEGKAKIALAQKKRWAAVRKAAKAAATTV
jgi:hypothetical protein